jgi:hypothetical protein
MFTGIVLGTVAGLAAVFESWPGLVLFVISFFFSVYKWVFGAEIFSLIKAEKKRRGQYWFEPLNEFADLRMFAPLMGRMLMFFFSFTVVTVAIVVPLKAPNKSVQRTSAAPTSLT